MTKSSLPAQTPAMQYLKLVKKSLARVRKDVPAISAMGEKMASHLLAGGELYDSPVCPFWPHEFGGRAGGLMGIRHGKPKDKNDVAFFCVPDRRNWDAKNDKVLAKLMESKSQLFVIGREDDVAAVGSGRFAGFTGGAEPEEGLYGYGKYRPLAPVRLFEQFVRAWIATGEMITACIRGGKMPTIWMSVWLEGALVRNSGMVTVAHNNLREPWPVPLFHEDRFIPPLAPGYACGEFLDAMDRILDVLVNQAAQLDQAGEWMAQAKAAGKRNWAVLVGHSYPRILDIPMEEPKTSEYPIEWGHSYSDLSIALPKDFTRGDTALHLGYAPVNMKAFAAIMKRGIRLIHTTPYGRPAELKDRPNFLWLDLPWRPADASVDIPGYSVRILPSSSSAQSMAYNAILCSMADRMGWK